VWLNRPGDFGYVLTYWHQNWSPLSFRNCFRK